MGETAKQAVKETGTLGMSVGEIVSGYRQAADKTKEITVLAQLSGASVSRIAYLLDLAGEPVPINRRPSDYAVRRYGAFWTDSPEGQEAIAIRKQHEADGIAPCVLQKGGDRKMKEEETKERLERLERILVENSEFGIMNAELAEDTPTETTDTPTAEEKQENCQGIHQCEDEREGNSAFCTLHSELSADDVAAEFIGRYIRMRCRFGKGDWDRADVQVLRLLDDVASAVYKTLVER